MELRVHVPHLRPDSPTGSAEATGRLDRPGRPGAEQVYLRAVLDGEPRITAARQESSDAYGSWWRAELRADNPVNSYRFLLVGTPDRGTGFAGGSATGASGVTGVSWLNGSGVHARDVTDADDFRILTHSAPPGWVADQVMYQIFPDRFGRRPDDPVVVPDWARPADWDDPVIHTGPDTPRQLYGGTLPGIVDHLDHLLDLGVTCLYLTPYFEARSNHRYDSVSFDRVDPLLGGDAAFAQLLQAAHAAGLRVLGDLTTNHTGSGHEWFRTAVGDLHSDEARFYRFDEHPGSYQSWLGIPSLPRLDHRSRRLRHLLYEGPGSVLARGLRAGLDGWRIDVANMTGRIGADDLAHAVARTVRRTMLAENGDAWLLAEHGHDASLDLAVGGWHGTMDYGGFTRPVWSWLTADPTTSPGAIPNGLTFLGLPIPIPLTSGRTMAATMRAFHAAMPWQAWTASTALLDSHDTPRFRTVVGGGVDGRVDGAGIGRDRHLLGLALQFTLPGVPSVFMGDELGLTGIDGEHARTPFPWAHRQTWDEPTRSQYRAWAGLRRGAVALRRGGLRWVASGRDSVTYLREHPEQRMLVHVVRAAHEPVELSLAALGLDRVERLICVVGEDAKPVDGARVALPAFGPGAHVYLLEPG